MSTSLPLGLHRQWRPSSIGSQSPIRIGVAGYGTIGRKVADILHGGVDGLVLAAIGVRGDRQTGDIGERYGADLPVVSGAWLPDLCEVVVDCAPAQAFRSIALAALKRGRILVTLSGAALLGEPDLRETAVRTGGEIVLASGSIAGLDALKAAAQSVIASVTVKTSKPPASLARSPRMAELGLDPARIEQATMLFSGSVAEGARMFPANVNVAAAVALAGIGAARTGLEVWADPAVSRNTHHLSVESDACHFTMTIENVPCPDNPATGLLAPLSIIAMLRQLVAPIRVGT